MRLINTDTLELAEFFGESIPPYAILSHTWERDEVTLQEWMNPTPATPSKAGYKKICMACSLARRYGHLWLWVDTNCIDKTSSADLSEAINSMFDWYSRATICFAYLFDVIRGDSAVTPGLVAEDANDQHNDLDTSPGDMLTLNAILPQFRKSRWFTRGWTLQELIAGYNLVFYSRDWVALGTKQDFAFHIAEITGISSTYLNIHPTHAENEPRFLGASVAIRMSWLAKRETTRIEDMAYCMLGLFDINMPLLYGEGTKAFLRLQEEIIKRYNDHTIFAWATDYEGHDLPSAMPPRANLGFLAQSPKAFTSAGSIRHRRVGEPGLLSPWSITNAGISIKLPVMWTYKKRLVVFQAFAENLHQHLAIVLGGGREDGLLSRYALPSSQLHVCRHLSHHFPAQDLYLKAFDRTKLVEDMKMPRSSHLGTARSIRRGYGLLLSFASNPEGTQRYFSFHPPSVFLDYMGVFEFPTDESDWLVTESELFNASTTGVVLWTGSPMLGFSGIVFTISIVNSKIPEKKPIHYIYSQFQPTERELDEISPRYRRESILDFSPAKLGLVQTEHMRVVSACRVARPSSNYIHEQAWGISGLSSSNIKISCCDMYRPSFTSLRLAVISDPVPGMAGKPAETSSELSGGMQK